jgi:hypothetical protein
MENDKPTIDRDTLVGMPGIAALFELYRTRPIAELLDIATDPTMPLLPIASDRAGMPTDAQTKTE